MSSFGGAAGAMNLEKVDISAILEKKENEALEAMRLGFIKTGEDLGMTPDQINECFNELFSRLAGF